MEARSRRSTFRYLPAGLLTGMAAAVANRTSPWASGGHAVLDQDLRRPLRGRNDGDSARGCDEFGDLVEGGDGEPGDQSGSGGDNCPR